MFVCVCRQVRISDIANAVENGAQSFADIQHDTGASSCCGQCADFAQQISSELLSKHFYNAA